MNIQFTIEKKNNRSLAYLGVKITHMNEKTTVHRKPTINLKIDHSTTNTHRNYKLAAWNTYINRAIYISSTKELLDDELKIIEK